MILVIGKNGQLGSALMKLLGSSAIGVSSQEINFVDLDFTDKIAALFKTNNFSTIINAAAYTQVDNAQSENGRLLAMRINAASVGELAQWCKANSVRLVHYSTDYVFSGKGDKAIDEKEQTAPLNIYGISKVAGENLLAQSKAEYLIFRTSWIYDERGRNFFTTMLRLFKEREELKIVADQTGAPTYALHLAKATLSALANVQLLAEFPSGIYHLCASGHASWHEFATEIFTLARQRESGIKCRTIIPIATADYQTPAKRPLNSRLDCSKAAKILGVSLPSWQEGLRECYENKLM